MTSPAAVTFPKGQPPFPLRSLGNAALPDRAGVTCSEQGAVGNMKSIGETSIAPPARAGFREFSTRGNGRKAAAGASTWWPEGEAGPTAARCRAPCSFLQDRTATPRTSPHIRSARDPVGHDRRPSTDRPPRAARRSDEDRPRRGSHECRSQRTVDIDRIRPGVWIVVAHVSPPRIIVEGHPTQLDFGGSGY